LKNNQPFASYQYDANGNRTSATVRGQSVTGTFDAQDRLLSYGPNSYTYKGNGDLASKTNSQTSTTSLYSYDLFGQLSSVQLSATSRVDYSADGERHRILRQVNGQPTQQLIYGEASRIIATLDQNSGLSHFVYGMQKHSPDYMSRSGHDYLLIKDHLGSVRLVVEASSGNIVQTLEYSEFGEVLFDNSPGFQPFGFAGGLYDYSTGIVRFGTRDYDPQVGRWMSKDGILFNGGTVNLYEYAANDPVNNIDTVGKNISTIIVGTAVVGSIIGYSLYKYCQGHPGDFICTAASNIVHSTLDPIFGDNSPPGSSNTADNGAGSPGDGASSGDGSTDGGATDGPGGSGPGDSGGQQSNNGDC
jgi:RHS repeat-associated protein